MRIRRRIRLQGTIQGIGFRPFVHRLASREGLVGISYNEGLGAVVEVEGPSHRVASFESRLSADLPSPGRIDRYVAEAVAASHLETGFSIVESHNSRERSISLPPDLGVCPECLQEMSDPSNRRYRYPFINCTACGPRYTIALDQPYDRPNTTMAVFPMCPECRQEYTNIRDRRCHAQPIACPECGPRTWLIPANRALGLSPQEEKTDPAEAVDLARELLTAGKVLAVKGIGGFHLAVDASNRSAVSELRKRKNRPRKPFAVMVRDLTVARRIVVLKENDEKILCSPASPIVLAPARPDHGLAEELAPGLGDLGIMLAYSPLHRLLFDETLEALVMTSGNPPSEPIITENQDAVAGLPADAYLMHDRGIQVANDDSVVRTTSQGPVFIRRSRGYVPVSLNASRLPRGNLIALGAELKVTITTMHHGRIFVGRHLGDLNNLASEEAFQEEVSRVLNFEGIAPKAVALDMHPDLATTIYGEERFRDLPIIRVQHHHAHMGAAMLEHGFGPEDEAAGIILDGMGYGPDGTIWGGEVLIGGFRQYQRLAHLRPIPMPGGDKAALQPWRMATSLLVDSDLGRPGMTGYDEEVAQICQTPLISPLTSSAGRLFDGVAALLGVAPKTQDYEGEAAARLEAVADPHHGDAYPLPFNDDQLDTRHLIEALVADHAPLPIRAARFHNALADSLAQTALFAQTGVVVLGGGCFVNRLLIGRLVNRLRTAGIDVRYPSLLPPGDGGLSAGQAACAACMMEEG